MNNLLQETTKLILEAIHGCSYCEAIKKEDIKPITLSRVLQALTELPYHYIEVGIACNKDYDEVEVCVIEEYGEEQDDYYVLNKARYISPTDFSEELCEWKLLKDTKETATLEDQSEETISAIYNILKQ